MNSYVIQFGLFFLLRHSLIELIQIEKRAALYETFGRFSSVIDIKIKLMEELEDQVPPTTHFSVGYFVGRQSTKKVHTRRCSCHVFGTNTRG